MTADFKHDHGASDFYNELKEEIKSIKEQVEAIPKNIRDDRLVIAYWPILLYGRRKSSLCHISI